MGRLRRVAAVIAAGVFVTAATMLYFQWSYLFGPKLPPARTVTREDALRLWNRLSSNFAHESLTFTEPTLLADVDDDGVYTDADLRLIAGGTPEWIRIDDTLANGRSHIHDRTPYLDDDLQRVLLLLPNPSPDTIIDAPDTESLYFQVYRSDWLDEAAELRWPLRIGDVVSPSDGPLTLPIWIRAPAGTPTDRPLPFTLEVREKGGEAQRITLYLHAVDELGHPGYFAAVRDYLMERDRGDSARPKVFRDAVECASSENPDEFEMMQLVAMRHEVTKFSVLETFYDAPLLQPRIKDIFSAAARHPHQTVIVNGNYYHVDTGSPIPHGRSCLGAVVHNHTISPATGRHWWFTYPGDGRPRGADWHYTSYCLVQEENRPGVLELREEPLDPNPYIPMIERNGRESPAHMALGGINTVHNFVHSVCGRKSHIWLARARGFARGPEHKLICLAMSDTVLSTSFCGGPAFRQKLRDSGVVIEEGDPARGIPPGKCEMAYFDGGASIAMAVNLDGQFEFPTFTSRHEPRNRHVHVNNYAMFEVVDE